MFQGAHDATKSQENPFWLYSLKQYKSPNCAQFLLDAQDQLDLDINLLLFFGWLSSEGKTLELSKVLTHSQIWQSQVVKPIRQLRRRIKYLNHDSFYQATKQLELRSEQHQQDWLYQQSLHWPQQTRSFKDALSQMVREYLQQEGIEEKEEWLQALSEYLQP